MAIRLLYMRDELHKDSSEMLTDYVEQISGFGSELP